MEILLIVSALLNVIGGITLLITLRMLRKDNPPF